MKPVLLYNKVVLFVSGKTTAAVVLARRYEAALLTIDGVVLDAIANGNSPAGLKARAMCAEAARKRAEEIKMMEGEEEKKPVGLSVEAVTAHAQGLLFFHHLT
jgi:hydrocephalus-inducing protein